MSSKAIANITKKTTGHGGTKFKPRATLDTTGPPDSGVGGSNKVFVDNKGVNRLGDRWKPHGTPPNLPGRDGQHATDTDGRPDLTKEVLYPCVFADNKAVAKVGDKVGDSLDCTDTIAGGDSKVFIGDNSEFETFKVRSVAFVVERGDVDFVTPANSGAKGAQSTGAINSGVARGIVPANSPLLAPSTVGTVDNTPPPDYSPSVSVNGDFSSFNQDNIPYATLMLTDKTSLAEFTTRAALWGNQPRPNGPNTPYSSNNPNGGDNKYIKAQYGLTVPQILTNLANLAKNVYEPIKARYPRVIVTNTFRQAPPGGSAEQAQHGRGQAVDLVFPGYANNQYYDIAVWIRDHLPFDQLLQEKSGSKIWIHVSHYSGTGQKVPTASKVANLLLTPKYAFIPGLAPIS